MKTNVLIADITTLTLKNKLYGHFSKTAKLYKLVLENKFNVSFAGGYSYKEESFINSSNFIQLPFVINKIEKKGFKKIRKIVNIFKEFINTKKVLRLDTDIIIFQSYSKFPIYIALILSNIQNKKIYMIEYQYSKTKGIKSYLRKVAINKIEGIITSNEEIGKKLKKEYLVVPDYFYIPSLYSKNINKKQYDFAILGTVSNQKNYEEVINAVNNSKYKLLIAGKFLDEERYLLLKSISKDNITIINSYITDEEYTEYIKVSKFIVLPYNPSVYSGKSSGVVLDAIYNNTPVIAPNFNSFEFVEKNNLGILYKNSFNEIMSTAFEDNYNTYKLCIEKYINNINIYNDKFIEFLSNK